MHRRARRPPRRYHPPPLRPLLPLLRRRLPCCLAYPCPGPALAPPSRGGPERRHPVESLRGDLPVYFFGNQDVMPGGG